MNKRGQSEWMTIVALIVAVAILVLALTLGPRILSLIRGTGNVSPSELELAKQGCQGVQISSPDEFCGKLQNVGSKNYATCDSGLVNIRDEKPDCSDQLYKDRIIEKCVALGRYPVKIYTIGGEKEIAKKEDCSTLFNAAPAPAAPAAKPGALNGACRAKAPQCDNGLVCTGQTCLPGSPVPAAK